MIDTAPSNTSNKTTDPFIPVQDNQEQQNNTPFGLNPNDLIKKLRPWTKFFAGDRFARPASMDEVVGRLRVNPVFFATNYLVIFILLIGYCALTHWSFLFALGVSGSSAWILIKRTKENPERLQIIEGYDPVPVVYLWWGWAAMTAILSVICGAFTDIFWAIGLTSGIAFVHSVLHLVLIVCLCCNTNS